MAKTKIHGEYLDPSVISGQTQVTAVGADSMLIFDATDNALKKALLSDLIETVGATPSFTSATISGDLTVDTSTLKVDSSNNRVGIGTTSPSQKLETTGNIFINAASGNPDLTIKTAGAGNNPSVNYRAGNNIVFDNMLVASAATDYWRVGYGASGTVNNEYLAVTSSGNVGIGTTTPSAKLTITKEGAGQPMLQVRNYATSATGSFGNTHSVELRSATSGSTSHGVLIHHHENNISRRSLEVADANGVFATFVQGKVGISNASPGALLHVGGDGISLNSTTDVSRTSIFRTTGTGNYSTSGNNSAAHAATFMRGDAANTGDQIGHSYVFNNGGWSATAEIMAEVEDNSTAYSRLNFKTWRGAMATRQVITSEGYVVKAYQPYIRCAGNSGSMVANQGTTADFSNWTNQVQRGITRSGATFTVPIAGEYLVTYSFYNWINNSGPNVTHSVFLQKNSSSVQETVAEYDFENDAFSYMDNQLQNSLILNMAAGDTFKFVTFADIYGGSTHTNMSAYLLG